LVSAADVRSIHVDAWMRQDLEGQQHQVAAVERALWSNGARLHMTSADDRMLDAPNPTRGPAP
jgi:hypothetical protein